MQDSCLENTDLLIEITQIDDKRLTDEAELAIVS